MVHITSLGTIAVAAGGASLPQSAAVASYGGLVTSRGPLTLAALASAAVPGLDPDTVEGVVPSGPGDPVEVAFVSDRDHRRWVIRCPTTPAASAHIERSAALLALLSRRLTMPVPWVKGWVPLPEGGRAAVHTYLTGRLVNLDGIEPESTIAVGLGRAIAQLHNLDPRIYEEAGTPVYDAVSYRARRLAELDRAAATGRVPTGLLTRWEQVLDDESLWAFSTTATHGALGSESVLATPDDGSDIDIKAFLGWESAQVADPADDLAPLLAELDPQAFGTVYESYVHNRVERPDRHIQERARVIGEMQLVRAMMTAVATGDDEGAEEHAAQLRRLDERLAREEEARRTASTAAPAVPLTTPTEAGPAPSEATTTDGSTDTDAGATDPEATTSGTQPVPTDVVAADGPTATATPGTPTVRPEPDADPTGPITTSRPADSTGSVDSTEPVDSVSGDASGADDAVQVEHPAALTPVTRIHAVPDSADSDSTHSDSTAPEGPTPDVDPTTDPDPVGTDDCATGRADAVADDAPRADATPEVGEAPTTDAPATLPSRSTKGNDHVTAEITPINDDDDGDDVVPLKPR